ncbi:MAG: aminodeoxychorismate synthase component I [Bacteroidota bacterium]
MTSKQFEEQIARFLKEKQPFFFMISFDKQEMFAYTFKDALEKNILFAINGITNANGHIPTSNTIPKALEVTPFPFASYLKRFEKVMEHLKKGNSFLLNLTFPSRISNTIDLNTVFHNARANYKLLYKDDFVCFSPECFIKIRGNTIYSYPMKGTIDATIENAATQLLNDPKETQEHNTIVDLIRNDMAMIAKEVTVTKFRYVEKIRSARSEILQTSTEIRGKLPLTWQNNFAQLLLSLLPAGSVSGAPKTKTVEIINAVENYKRGFYTGVFGIFDGENIDSAVAIRFIEKNNGTLWYKSGGGITHNSNVKEEYVELLRKIYIPAV